jgi:hypothetical protein
LRLLARYLGFRRNLIPGLRRLLKSGGLFRTLDVYAPVLRGGRGRFRLRLAFSAGDAAETAVLHGGLCLFFNRLFPPGGPPRRGPEVSLEPRFLSRREAVLDCDISLVMPAAVFFFRLISASVRGGAFARHYAGKKRSPHV